MNLLGLGTALGGFMSGFEQSRKNEDQRRQQQIQQRALIDQIRRANEQERAEGIGFRGAVGGLGNTPDLSGMAGIGGGPQSQPSNELMRPRAPVGQMPPMQPASFSPSQAGAETMPSGKPLVRQSNPVPANARYGGNEQADRSRIEGMNAAGVGKSPIPLLNTPQGRQMADMGAGKVVSDAGGGGQQQAQPSIPPELQQQAAQTAQRTASSIDPSLYGQVGLNALAQRIEKVAPNEPDHVKFLALQSMAKILAPDQRMQFQMLMQQNRQDLQLALKDMQIQAANARQDKGIEASDRRQDKGIEAADQRQDKSIANRQPRSMPAMFMKKWMEEHPDATAEDVQLAAAGYRRDQAIEGGFGAGEPARNLRSLNTAAGHLELLRGYADALKSGDIPRANQLVQALQRETGHSEITNFETARDITADEVVRLLTSTGGTEADRKSMQERIKASGSPEQLMGSLAVVDRFITERLDALEQQYARNDPKRREAFEGQMLTDPARGLMKNRKGGGGKAGKYTVGQIIDQGGKKYRVTGGDLNGDPEVEPVQ